METRVDKYKDKEFKQSRVEKNKDLYKMIYTAYDEFENYKVPLEEKEIDLSKISKNITSRSDYRKVKQYGEFTDNKIVKKEEIEDNNKVYEKDVYDIKTLLSKVKEDNNDDRKSEMREEKYLDKLHLKDKEKTNLDIIKEKYEEIILDSDEEEKLFNTANLSLEILSDLKSNEDTMISPPMKDDEEDKVIDGNNNFVKDDEMDTNSFYSDTYKFDKKDFEGEEDDFLEESNNKFLFKILIIIAFVILIALILIYLIGYFS